MSQAGKLSDNAPGSSDIVTINGIGPNGSGNFTIESSNDSVEITGITNGLDLTVPLLSNFIVGPTGNYVTIQDAVDAAIASLPTTSVTIYVQPGTYTEDIDFSGTVSIPNGVTLVGSSALGDQGQVEIVGTHNPPFSGIIILRNFKLSDASAIFSSSAAGTSQLVIIDAYLNVTNGFTFDIPNWTSAGKVEMFDINGGLLQDGFLNNTGGCQLFCFAAGIGSGTTQTMVASGFTYLDGVNIGCPATFTTGCTLNSSDNNWFGTVTLSGNATSNFTSDYFIPTSGPAITQSSSGAMAISSSAINTANNPAISGSGSGAINMAGVNFISGTNIAGTLTISRTNTFDVGTIRTNLTDHSILIGKGTGGNITALGSATNGQLPIGSTGADPVLATLTAGIGINITNAAGSITISADNAGFTWSDQSGAFAAAQSNGYFITGTSTATLPASPSQGDTIKFNLDTANILTIQANTGQSIRISTAVSTVAGTAVSTFQGDAITLVYRTTGATWHADSSIGVWGVT